jgi:hypothetical protein
LDGRRIKMNNTKKPKKTGKNNVSNASNASNVISGLYAYGKFLAYVQLFVMLFVIIVGTYGLLCLVGKNKQTTGWIQNKGYIVNIIRISDDMYKVDLEIFPNPNSNSSIVTMTVPEKKIRKYIKKYKKGKEVDIYTDPVSGQIYDHHDVNKYNKVGIAILCIAAMAIFIVVYRFYLIVSYSGLTVVYPMLHALSNNKM